MKKGVKWILIVVAVFAVAVGTLLLFTCRRAGKTEFPSGVQTVSDAAQVNIVPDHLVVVSFDGDAGVLDAAAGKFAGKAEFFAVSDNMDLMMQLGVETIPTVLLIKPGGEVGERLIGDIAADDLIEVIAAQLP